MLIKELLTLNYYNLMHSIKELQTIFKESIQDFKLNDYPAGLNSPVNYIMGLVANE